MQNGQRTILLSALTSLIVSSLVLAGGAEYLRLPANGSRSGTLTDLTSLERQMQEQSPVIDVVRRAEPAVVSVIISKDLPVVEQYYERVPLGDSPFSIRVPRTRRLGTERQEVGGGTAFFISKTGLLMTNKHVVSDEEAKYSVLLNDGRTLEAAIVARDSLSDIALLTVEGEGYPSLEFAEEDEPMLGQTVVAIGNALAEFRNTVSVGVISGLQRTITAGNPSEGAVERLNRIIQTDAAINQGNSGGPLLDLEGNVIGMNTAVASDAQNIGFAIPVGDLRRIRSSYERYGRIVRPYLGVRYATLTDELARNMDLPYTYGVVVTGGDSTSEPGIVPGSPAEKAGLKVGDVILEIDGQEITKDFSLSDIVQRKQPGDAVRLLISRDKREQEMTVTLEELKSQ